jgi:hypothetical protein
VTFIVDPTSVSFASILKDLEDFLDAAPDAAKWKDFFASSTGSIVKQFVAGTAALFSYNNIVARREAFIRYAENRSSIIGAAQSQGYSAYRGRNATLTLTVIPSVTTVWPRWTSIGLVKDLDILTLGPVTLNAGIPVTFEAIIGQVKESTQTASSDAPSSFRFRDPLVSQDVRVYFGAVEMTPSEKLIDMLSEKVAIQSNVFGSADVLYLNLPDFDIRFSTGAQIKLQWIELRDLTFAVADVKLTDSVLQTAVISNTYISPEAQEAIQINAPLSNETQFVIRGRDDYKKIFSLLDTDILSTSGEDVSPAVVRLYYVLDGLRLFSPTEKADFVQRLSVYRPFGMLPPVISDPSPVFVPIKVTVALKGSGPIATDVGNIIDDQERKLQHQMSFATMEETTEALSYVKVARYFWDFVPWAPSTLFRRGNIVVPTSPTVAQNDFVYESLSKLYKSGTVEPIWDDALGASNLDQKTIKSGGVHASIFYNGARYCAANPGTSGAFILLVFDGTKTNQKVVDEWNDAHPENPVILCEGDPFAVSPAGTLRVGVNAGAAAADPYPAGGTVGSGAVQGAGPSGSPSGTNGIGTGILWTTQACLGSPISWQPNTTYLLGDEVGPSSAALLANPALATRCFTVSGFENRSGQDIDSVNAGGTYSGACFQAENPGVIGNSITLAFDGVKTVAQVMQDWNTLHPNNRVASCSIAFLSSVLPSGSLQLSGGSGTQATGFYSGVTFRAADLGVEGNTITLSFDGSSTVEQVVTAHNNSSRKKVIRHPISLDLTVPPAGTVSLLGGTSALTSEPNWPVNPVIC